ncbi:MAG: hypothetical protein HY042_11915 [Spirochaetia bacterium]|nr:hypothetical protein [Spirochaetia bacterium]
MNLSIQRLLAAALLIAVVSSCGLLDRKIAGYRGYSEICIDGVKYLQFTSGASVKYTKEGRIDFCN